MPDRASGQVPSCRLAAREARIAWFRIAAQSGILNGGFDDTCAIANMRGVCEAIQGNIPVGVIA